MERPAILPILLGIFVIGLAAEPLFFNRNAPQQTAHAFHVPVEPIVQENACPVMEKPAEIPAQTTATSSAPQFVVFSFDGSKSIQKWKDTLEFASQMQAQGKPISFTYFISGVYLLDPEHTDAYAPPQEKPGTSRIGFADSQNDVYARIHEINRAIAQGHEIASHLNGHFDGSNWTAQDWEQELLSFRNLVLNPEINNKLNPEEYRKDPINLKASDIVGFRAPLLAVNDNLWSGLKQCGYRYDAGHITKADAWPAKNAAGVWQFPLPLIRLAGTNRHMLAMDYNFYVAQTQARDELAKGTPAWDAAYKHVVDSYMDYFNQNYKGNRAPVYSANHFSEWNDALYWEAMKTFASQVCGLSDVKCVNFKDLADYMDLNANTIHP